MSFNSISWGGTLSDVAPLTPTDAQPDVTQGRLTYSGFIFWLQRLGINPLSVRSNHFGVPIGRGESFSVSRHRVRPTSRHAMSVVVSLPGAPLWSREMPDVNTYVAFKRVIVHEKSATMDVSDQGQLYAICREIQALLHPKLREHESIIKLQSIFWENGFGAGDESDLPMWPTLVLEYCENNLADYQRDNKPLDGRTKFLMCSKIGSGLEALHSAKIFHGDLKSENILIKMNKNGVPEPKIADFGFSIVLERSKMNSRYYIGGTEMWCAPECPGYFTDEKAIAATDLYSFGLLSLRIGLDGRNPFEELGFVRQDWSTEEKVTAIRSLKEDDLLYPLLCEKFTPSEFLATHAADDKHHFACFLLADPIRRLEAVESYMQKMLALVPAFAESIKSKTNADASLEFVSEILEQIQPDPNDSEVEDEEEEDPDPLDIQQTFSSALDIALIPIMKNFSTMSPEGMLNSRTRSRLVEELRSIKKEHSKNPSSGPCAECCTLSRLDMEPHLLSPESLIDEVKRIISTVSEGLHSCQALVSNNTAEESRRSQALWGFILSPSSYRLAQGAYQLFLVTATGFGTERNGLHALEILEEAVATGLYGLCIPLCQYARSMGFQLPMHLPLRKWLTILVLFTSGIPSGAFRVLSDLDPGLAETVRAARSKLYNGYTSTFEAMQINGIHVIDTGEPTIPTCYLDAAGVFAEMYENTLLHLAAGSEGMDTTILSFCITQLGIDVDVRNEDGATPLLMACRAGREAKILALLDLGADVTLKYIGGETPLHWLGMLPEPGHILEQFLARGADINAYVFQTRNLPNFLGDYEPFYQPGSPLMWAMAMNSEQYVKVLIKNGADVSSPLPNRMSPFSFACRPAHCRFLRLLSTSQTFRARLEDAYFMIINWGDMEMLGRNVTLKDQRENLGLILNEAMPFLDLNAIVSFYKFLIPKAAEIAKIEIVEMVLSSLSQSMATVADQDVTTHKFAKKPLAHPIWKHHHFVQTAATRGDPEILRAVLSYGGDATSLDEFDRSALHMVASSSNDPRCIDVLMSYGAFAVMRRRLQISGMTAFAEAVANCNFIVANRLFENTVFKDREVLLSMRGFQEPPSSLSLFGHFVAWSSVRGPKPLEYLLELPETRKNPDSIFIVDTEFHLTALMMASGLRSGPDIYDQEIFALTRRKKSMQILLKYYPEPRHINQKTPFGVTALHLAAWMGNADIVTALLDAGAEINPVNNWGQTPLDVTFDPDPSYLLEERELKRFIITIFEKNRNYICEELRSRGGRHNSRMSIQDSWDDHIPFPWLHEKRALAKTARNSFTRAARILIPYRPDLLLRGDITPDVD